MNNPMSFLSVALCVATTGAGAQLAQPMEISAFTQHPTYCAVLLGGPDRIADGADKAFGEALSTTTMAIGGPADMALARIHAECVARPTTYEVLDRPEPRASL